MNDLADRCVGKAVCKCGAVFEGDGDELARQLYKHICPKENDSKLFTQNQILEVSMNRTNGG